MLNIKCDSGEVYRLHGTQLHEDKATTEVDSAWLKIGVAFMHVDGHGYDVVLDTLPVNGCVVLRTNDERIKELQKKSG